jgi:fimbrial chaperone protein
MTVHHARVSQAVLGLAFLLCTLAGAHRAAAATLVLSPLRLSLSTKNPIGALTVRNDSDSATVVQLETLQWTQADGVDAYAATPELLATPPIFTLAAHASQLVRVGLRRAPDPARELSYRLFLQEVPPAATAEPAGLHVAVRFGVPVFVAAPASTDKSARSAAGGVQWRLRRAAGRLTLSARNDTATHLQVTALTLHSGGVSIASDKTPCYLLAGQRREWLLTPDRPLADGAPVQVSASTDAGVMQAEVLPGER